MNWGKSIVLAFVLFAGFIGTLVYRMTRQQVDLVSDNYYQREIDYQQHIDRVRNARLNPAVTMIYHADQQQVILVLPRSLRRGGITFYRPGDRQQDRHIAVSAGHATRQVIPTKDMARGNWRVQFSWSDGQRSYYKEEQLFL